MARRKFKKLPITAQPTLTSSKPSSTRKLIRRFHVLLKEKAKLSSKQDATRLAELEAQITSLGDLPVYQNMSAIGQGDDRGGGSEKILIEWLKGFELHKSGRKLKLLEVGALKPDNYHSCPWIATTPIDLHSRHPEIHEQDFLKLDLDANQGQWDLISLSLVLNFVPDATDRGRMLCLAHDFLVSNGYLFLTLPLPCVQNSRYLDEDRLRSIMESVGFAEIKSKWKRGGKMAYWLYQNSALVSGIANPQKKTVLRQGSNRNNFAIRLPIP